MQLAIGNKAIGNKATGYREQSKTPVILIRRGAEGFNRQSLAFLSAFCAFAVKGDSGTASLKINPPNPPACAVASADRLFKGGSTLRKPFRITALLYHCTTASLYPDSYRVCITASLHHSITTKFYILPSAFYIPLPLIPNNPPNVNLVSFQHFYQINSMWA